MEAQGQKHVMTPEELTENKEQADIQAELHPEKYPTKRAVKGIVGVNGADAYVVEAEDAKGKKSTEFYDVATGFIVKQIGASEGGNPGQVTEFADYQEVPGSNGYKMPYTVKFMGAEFKIQSVDINKGISDKEFE